MTRKKLTFHFTTVQPENPPPVTITVDRFTVRDGVMLIETEYPKEQEADRWKITRIITVAQYVYVSVEEV